MKRILYPLIATALITVLPFLSTFEKGQDIVRGLFDFCVLALLLLFMLVRDRTTFARKPLMGCVFAVLFLVAVADLQNILSYKGWNIGWRIVIPLITCSVAIVLLKPIKAFSLRGVSFFLFAALMSHCYLNQFFPSQPIFEFPVAKWLARTTTSPEWARNHLTDEFREKNNATDSVSITRYYVDTTRSNVVILVESWGIPMDSNMFAKELAVFNGLVKERGIHFRMSSRTRTAERTDLLDSAWRSQGRRDSLYTPNRFAKLGYQTSFFFGGDSTIQWRYHYIRRIGFQQEFWTDTTTSDAVMALKIDSLLGSTDNVRHFIAWTTRDTRFPISDNAEETEKLYYERLFATMQIVADLAKKHPNVRFVVQGDHEPILSPLEFQRKFYRRWVPFVVLN
ncbi:hypothetical protein SAMN05720472_1610 [Fibrobacter sp. UWR3]|uniref:hypothetical protein n=1 Tax=Fibrobacter sp. UWR3 TaxID=1896217 RepID=UPI00091EFC86|nr:hypothetical protein [Fibrobacter sp. UWR3]SHM55171.1 hypothetical protein SAMN05720472_1610 [Fibrobacter sp. UWR3]